MSTLVEGIEAIPSASRREAEREDVLARMTRPVSVKP
jgi:hypothetical protein